ncbi:uncharacterized protein LOC143274583 [Babylonia areolata]|uniref:uncharacterized protein LOC143274583 n=1 Tax=Babylonia areolata TaxID=304850 RepID=UPI003FCF4AE5
MGSKGEEVVIGYNLADLDFVKRVAGTLRDEGLTVWYADPNSDPSSMDNKTQAILACKIYIPVLSQVSVEDKHLQEQLSLAYVSNSAIFPLGTTRHRFIAPKLNGGAKLILAKINWCFVLKEEDYNKNITSLMQCIRTEMKRRHDDPDHSRLPPTSFSVTTHGVTIPMTHGLVLGDSDGYEGSVMPSSTALMSEPMETYTPFWQRHFAGRSSVEWGTFKERFLQDYGPLIEQEFGDSAEERKKLIVNLMYKDIFHLSPVVENSVFEAFCVHHKGQVHRFYRCVMEYLAAYMSLREIISMDSSLRITTIQSLGKFTFPVIVSGLVDLLRDEDANIRAVAAIALAHAGKGHKDTMRHLVGLLEDEDRLVRESACLSLGFLKAADAVDHIVDRWRNDPISTVREAAELALSKMNIPEAQRCIKVTQILSSEMSALKPKEE